MQPYCAALLSDSSAPAATGVINFSSLGYAGFSGTIVADSSDGYCTGFVICDNFFGNIMPRARFNGTGGNLGFR
jgi:hypothetical protein